VTPPPLEDIREAILGGAGGDALASLPLPAAFRAVVVRKGEDGLFVEEVPRPDLEPDEVHVAVMASSLNYTTVWAAVGEPVSTFRFLERLGGRHDQPWHVVGSDASGVVVRVGVAVRGWKPGDRVVVHPSVVEAEDPGGHDDDLLAPSQRVWGYETNFGGLAEMTVVKASQLLPKPSHLSWEEAASLPLCSGTAYRMVVSGHGAAMRQGDVVLVWGAAGGVGSYAVQYVLNGGGVPVGVVSSPEKADLLRRLGCEAVIDRRAEGYRFWRDDHTQDEGEWRRLGARIRELVGADPDIVVEHPGRETMGASVFVARRGGTVVTCAATTGYRVEFDNRHLWMRLKRVVGTQLSNYAEGWAANRLACQGRIQPTLSSTCALDGTAGAAAAMAANRHHGKLGVLCLAPEPGLGIDDPELRAWVGEDRVTLFRR
jgi:crotonyl-CoA reductase